MTNTVSGWSSPGRWDAAALRYSSPTAALTDWRPVVVAVVSDVAMPMMNGLELARVVLERYPGVPILFVTASSVSGDLLSNPLVGYVKKPVRIAEMCERLDTLISRATDASRTPHHAR